METILSNFVNMLNNSMQSYITYLYVRELCQTLVILMFAGPLMYFACKLLDKAIKEFK